MLEREKEYANRSNRQNREYLSKFLEKSSSVPVTEYIPSIVVSTRRSRN